MAEVTERREGVELEILYRISRALAHGHDVSDLLNEVLDIMETEMGMSHGTLTLRKPDTDAFVIEASRGLTQTERDRGQYLLGEGITGRVAKTGKPLFVSDITKDPDFLDRTRTRKRANVAFLCEQYEKRTPLECVRLLATKPQSDTQPKGGPL